MAEYSNIAFQNNGKLKLLIIVGTRPEIIRLSAVILTLFSPTRGRTMTII